jgi:CHAD domain-containing protein/HD superfamily phosphodiesterase
MLASPALATRPKKVTGLRYWMSKVLEECENVAADFNPDSVHDLRVALRRCRSLADGLMALDPDPDWKNMKKAGKRLFQSLGELRDIQVMEEWVEKLRKIDKSRSGDESSLALRSTDQNSAPTENTSTSQSESEDPAAQSLLGILKAREQEQKHLARAALEEFDRKQWRRWSKSLPARASRIRPSSPLYKHLALERWTEARQLHARALRNRSQTAFHTLRIGIKRFRYIVENFLPEEHKAWSDDLKEMQDELGEVHDLDVLWTTAVSCLVFPNDLSRQTWHALIAPQRSKRIDRYRAKMVGDNSLWQVWRAALPQGKQVQELATRRMKLWARGLDPDFPHSERVADLALQLYDGLLAIAWKPAIDAAAARSSLLAAALLHDVGKVNGDKNHHKKSLKLIQSHGNPLGWKPAEFQRAAVIARFHRGALPTTRHPLLRDLLHAEQKATIQLVAILRLANALDATHDGHIRSIQIENVEAKAEKNRQKRTGGFLRKPPGLDRNEALVIAAEGYAPLGAAARTLAAERYLLETVLHRPVLVNPMIHGVRLASRQIR